MAEQPTRMKKLSTVFSPEDEEAQAFREKQAQIDEYNRANAAPVSPKNTYVPSPMDRVGYKMYGNRPGEQRINVENMVKPLGASYVVRPEEQTVPTTMIPTSSGHYMVRPAEPMAPTTMQQKAVPVYDNGGDVNAAMPMMYDDGGNVNPSFMRRIGNYLTKPSNDNSGGGGVDPSQMQGQSADTSARFAPIQGLDQKNMPVYDDGGIVSRLTRGIPPPDLNKTPVQGMSPRLHELVKQDMMSEPDLYPKSTSPSASDEIDPEELTKYNENKAARMSNTNKDKNVSMYDDGGPVKNDPYDGHHQMAVLEEGERVLTPEENQRYEMEHNIGAPRMMPISEDRVFSGMEPGAKMLQQPNPPVRMQSDQDRMYATQPKEGSVQNAPAGQGGLTGDISNPVGNEATAPAMREMSTGGAPKMAAPEGLPHEKVNPLDTGTPSQPLPSDHDWLNRERSVLKQKMMDAALGTNNNGQFDHKAYAESKMALADLNRANPWGSPENRPGLLGEFLHGLGRAGEVASDIVLGPGVTGAIPGTQEYLKGQKAEGEQELQTAISQQATEAETALKQAQARTAGMGTTVQEKYRFDLLHNGPGGQDNPQINPTTGKPYTPTEADQAAIDYSQKGDEGTIRYLMDHENMNRFQAQKYVAEMKAGLKPKTGKEQAMQDYMASKGWPDTAVNRDRARVEIEKRDTSAKAEAGLPVAEQKIRLQNQLAEAKSAADATRNKALAYGEKASEFQYKENQRHNDMVNKIDAAQSLLDQGLAGNELANNIVPVITTMTSSNIEAIKRLNQNELSRFLPGGSGDFYRWMAAHYDKFFDGDIPPEYRKDVRGILNGYAQQEQDHYDANMKSIDDTFNQSAITPEVNVKTGTAPTTKAKTPAAPAPKPQPAGGKTVQQLQSEGWKWQFNPNTNKYAWGK